MIKIRFSLYRTHLMCLCLSLVTLGCVNTNQLNQSMSDAKQALASVVELKEQHFPEDSSDILLAKGILNAGEQSLSQGKFSEATTLFEASKKYSQGVLKRHQSVKNKQNIKFRHQ